MGILFMLCLTLYAFQSSSLCLPNKPKISIQGEKKLTSDFVKKKTSQSSWLAPINKQSDKVMGCLVSPADKRNQVGTINQYLVAFLLVHAKPVFLYILP